MEGNQKELLHRNVQLVEKMCFIFYEAPVAIGISLHSLLVANSIVCYNRMTNRYIKRASETSGEERERRKRWRVFWVRVS